MHLLIKSQFALGAFGVGPRNVPDYSLLEFRKSMFLAPISFFDPEKSIIGGGLFSDLISFTGFHDFSPSDLKWLLWPDPLEQTFGSRNGCRKLPGD